MSEDKTKQLAEERRQEDELAKAERAAAGRHTLWDAATAIGSATATPFERVLEALIASANSGELAIYQDGATFPHKPGGTLGALSGHEAYWSALNEWLRVHAVQSTFAFPKPSSSGEHEPELGERDLPRLQQQEQRILRTLRELGFTPTALPKAPTGTGGPKAAVRGRLSYSAKVFDKAWGRLRANGDIQDAD